MTRIRHIAFAAGDPGNLADFYSAAFNMTVTERGAAGDVWLTDGYMDIALFPESAALPRGIRHFGFALAPDEKPAVDRKLADRDCRTFDPATGLPAVNRRFGDDAVHDPDGNRIDLAARADPVPPVGARPRIQHLAFFTERPDLLAGFYCDVFGMTLTGVTGRNAHWVTDGYVNVALLFKRRDDQPRGINHFGFIIDAAAKSEIYGKLDDFGIEVFQPGTNNDRPFVEDGALDVEGNRFDISTAVREIDEEMARPREGIKPLVATDG